MPTMTRFEMFKVLHEPASGWRNHEDAHAAFLVFKVLREPRPVTLTPRRELCPLSPVCVRTLNHEPPCSGS